MSNDPASYGPNLYRYLEGYWRANGTNQNAWCDAHPGIQAPTVSRWRTGTEPRTEAYRAVADALGVSILDILVAAGVITAAEAGGHVAAAPPPPSIDAAIKSDPNLSPFARKQLADILRALRAVESGEVEAVSSAPTRRRRK